jgi:hypothetical protein
MSCWFLLCIFRRIVNVNMWMTCLLDLLYVWSVCGLWWLWCDGACGKKVTRRFFFALRLSNPPLHTSEICAAMFLSYANRPLPLLKNHFHQSLPQQDLAWTCRTKTKGTKPRKNLYIIITVSWQGESNAHSNILKVQRN